MSTRIGHDKKKHFWVGIPLGLLLQFMSTYFLSFHPMLETGISLVMLVAICYGFEFLSLVTGKGHADHLDAIAGIIGGITGILVFWGGNYLS